MAGKEGWRAENGEGSSPGSAQAVAVTPPSGEPAPERRRARHEGDCAHPGGTVWEPDWYQGGPGRAFRSRGWAVGVAGLGKLRLGPGSQVDPAHSWWGTNPREPAVSPRADSGIQHREWATGPSSRLPGSGWKWATSPSCGLQRVHSGAPTRRVSHWSRRARPRELPSWSGPRVLRSTPVVRPRVSAHRPGIPILGLHLRLRARGVDSTELAAGPGAARVGGGMSQGGGGSLSCRSDSLSLRRSPASFGK